jgi:ABC-type uncharacterized transport system permease subunit
MGGKSSVFSRNCRGETKENSRQKETTNYALHGVVYGLHSGVFYFHNIIGFHGTHKNVISFPPRYSFP